MDIEHSDITINTTASAVAEADKIRIIPDSRIGLIIPTKKLKVVSWDLRNCKAESTQILLANEMKKYGISICCLSKTRLNDTLTKSISLTDPETLKFYNSRPTDGSGLHGARFFLDPIAASSVISRQPVSITISTLRLKGRIRNATILSLYAPIRDIPDDAKGPFYFGLQRILDSVPGGEIL